MAEAQMISQLKFRVTSLESALSDRQRQLEDLRGIQTQADSKIKAMTKIHNDKIKSLLNSIQILKKQKASLQGLSKEHKRSKLIEQLNKEIMDQDIVIDVLRKFIYGDKGKEKGRQVCDDIIVSALKKGPERIRAVTRQELRMEIEKLKLGNLNKTKGNNGEINKVKDFGQASQVSQLSQRSFVNQNQEIFKKLKEIQSENQNLKLDISTKGKIIEKLKNETKEKDRLKSEVELLTNQLEVSGRKVFTLERLLRETKENMHTKIGQLFERELKVQELQMNSKESGERLRQAHESTNLLLQEIKQEKEQLQVEIDLLKKENEGLMMEKMSMKSRQDEQKKKIQQIREINSKNKEDLGNKLVQLEAELQKLNQENVRLTDLSRDLQMKYFKEREQWIEQRQKLTEEGTKAKAKYDQAELQKSAMQQLNNLRKENRQLKEILESGTGASSDNKILLERLQNYRIRLQMYESKQDGKGKERELYDQLFEKYNTLLIQFEKLKKMVPSEKLRQKRLNIVQVTPNQEQKLKDISSGISELGLQDVGSDILDNYDSSYDYELRVDQVDRNKFKGIPKITEEDKELLKLISSDLWCFVKDDRVEVKLNEALDVSDKLDQLEEEELAERIRKIKNLSYPQGKKLVVYDSELKQMDEMSQNVSITSAIQKEIDQYDSDVNIEVKKMIRGSPSVNMRELNRISDSQSQGSMVSSVKSGESGFVKRKKGEKASVIKVTKEKGTESIMSASVDSEMNSSVSSVGVNQSLLAEINSDVSVDFRKRKTRK